MKLAYRFLVFCRDFFTWKVVKIKGRGGRRHIGGVVVCGSLKGLKTQTLSDRLVTSLPPISLWTTGHFANK
jgi:hypothetical protein